MPKSYSKSSIAAGHTPASVIPTINIADGLVTRSKKEQLAYDHPGHMMEHCFNITLGSIHWEWIDLVLEAYRNPDGPYNPLVILAPRDHAKTTVLTEGCTLWRIGQDPQTMIGQIISVVKEKAQERLSFIKSVIQTNQRYIDLFGSLYPGRSSDFTWNEEKIEVLIDRRAVWQFGKQERDATVAAYGITSNIEGGRTNWQVFDDIIGRENSRSEVSRIEVSAKFWNSFDPMLLPDGVQIIMGTRYAYDDIYAEFIKKFDTLKKWQHLVDKSDESEGEGEEESEELVEEETVVV